jgi:vacuolar-type H+-ATPase subunit H
VDLEQLIATEQRLDEALRAAREQASALVAEARTRAHQREAEIDAELREAEVRLAAETAAERERREREVAREAEARVALLDAVSAERVRQAAQDVVSRLVSGEGKPAS